MSADRKNNLISNVGIKLKKVHVATGPSCSKHR